MKFEQLDIKKHNTLKIAELICETDRDIFNFLFENKPIAAHKLSKLVIAGGNSLGHEHIVVAQKNDKIVGILLYSYGKGHHKLSELKVLFKNLHFIDVLKFILIDLKDYLILSDLNEHDFYLAGVAVDEKCRGKGVGTKILEKAIKMAQRRESPRLVLDVALSNTGAKKLYEKTGFKVFNKKSFPWFGQRIGMYNMELEV
jgi:ribosomal protein S18 acetylase RimI-like enzyme